MVRGSDGITRFGAAEWSVVIALLGGLIAQFVRHEVGLSKLNDMVDVCKDHEARIRVIEAKR